MTINLTATQLLGTGTNSVRLAWSVAELDAALQYNESASIVNVYQVIRTDASPTTINGQIVTTGGQSYYDLQDVAPGSQSFSISMSVSPAVLTEDGLGLTSLIQTTTATVILTMLPPSNMDGINIGETIADVIWAHNPWATSYQVTVNSIPHEIITAPSHSIHLDNLTEPTYLIQVSTVGVSSTSPLSLPYTLYTRLPQPSGVVVSNIRNDSFDMAWDIVQGASNYEVWDYMGDQVMLGTTAGNSWHFANLEAGTTYSIGISSTNGTTQGIAWQNKNEVTTLLSLSVIYSDTNNTITLSWDDQGATSYKVLYKTVHGSVYNGTGLTFDELATIPANSGFEVAETSIILYNAALDTPYWFAVQVEDGGVWVTIQDSGNSNVTPAMATLAVAIWHPVNVKIKIEETEEIKLTWDT